MSRSVLQDWVMDLGLRQQGVIVSAMRGCDNAPRHDPSKKAQRILRGAVLEPHGGREIKPSSYITYAENDNDWFDTMHAFVSNVDHYPHHYVLHFMHAAEIIGYYGPTGHPVWGYRWQELYNHMCHLFHVNPETKEQLEGRLNVDEKAFEELQNSYKR